VCLFATDRVSSFFFPPWALKTPHVGRSRLLIFVTEQVAVRTLLKARNISRVQV
jgi:hypothetical protein